MIHGSCFVHLRAKFIRFPRSAITLSASCFAEAKIGNLSFESEAQISQFPDLCFSLTVFENVIIPSSVESFGSSCFLKAKIPNLTFEMESHLRQLGECCFQCCLLGSICLPKSIEIIGKFCFAGDKSHRSVIRSLEFEKPARLTEFPEDCFNRCSIGMIQIPGSVLVLRKNCFAQSEIKKLAFELDSKLETIEELCFSESSLLSICIPNSVQVVAENSFHSGIRVTRGLK
jgi:hypothetical protein